jgi:50S ribosomal subunit-associated GTPase HflX
VRRKFFEAAGWDAEDPVPARVVARMDELFGWEAGARGWQGEAQREWRRRYAPPRLEALRAELEAVS